jgi:outer membrane protein assembly factor BamD
VVGRFTSQAQAFAVALLAALALGAAGCASTGRAIPPGTAQPDQFLFEKGNEAIEKKRWLVAREFYKQVTETYTQSPIRPDAKLGIGDTYLGEGSAESLVLAIAEFQEFLSFYPTHPRADYAQYKLAMAHFKQMRSPQRDQTETRDTIHELDTFIIRYPNSSLISDAKVKLRAAHDRLSESELEVGRFYFRIHWYRGAIDRLSTLLKNDPEFTGRDAAYFYLGECFMKAEAPAAALPYYEKIVKEFERSEYLDEARKRIELIKNPPPTPPSKTASKTS